MRSQKNRMTYSTVRRAANELYGRNIRRAGGWLVASGTAIAPALPRKLGYPDQQNNRFESTGEGVGTEYGHRCTTINDKNTAATISTAGHAADPSSGLNI